MHQSVQHPRIVLICSDVPRRKLIANRLTTNGFVIDVYDEGLVALRSIADTTPSTVDPKPWLVILVGSMAAIIGARLPEKINGLVGRKVKYIVLNSDPVQLDEPTDAVKQKQQRQINEYVSLQAADAILKLVQFFWSQRKGPP